MIKNLIIIALGGGIGSVLRYLVSSYILKYYSGVFPLPTFIVNVTGCILIGFFIGIADRFLLITPPIKLFLITGLCGGYTTFSTFSLENFQLMSIQDLTTMLLYASLSIILGIFGVWIGISLSKI